MVAVRWMRTVVVSVTGMAVVAGAGAEMERQNRAHGEACSALPAPCPAGTLFAAAADGAWRIVLPLRHTHVRLDVVPGVVQAEVEQTFTNDTETPLEAVYVYPLPGEATVTDMELQVGSRRIRSMVQRREEAQKTYETAKAQGRRTALMEQERPNLFTTSVANILPGDTVTVRFRYVEPLEYRWGVYALTFPMVVGPRYIPLLSAKREEARLSKAEAEEDARRICPPVLPPGFDSGHFVELEMTLRGLVLEAVRSPTHELTVEVSGETPGLVRVTPAEGALRPDGDLEVELLLASSETPRVTGLLATNGAVAHGLITVFPPLERSEPEAREPRAVVFVIDTSGSMDGESIQQARSGLIGCLDRLRPEDRFAVIRFSDDCSSFLDHLCPALPRNVALAKRYAASLKAKGGTEMLPALKRALQFTAEASEPTRMIVFLTDGCVGNEREILRMLGRCVREERLFTFGIGSAPNTYFLQQMARIGRGQHRGIRSVEHVAGVLSEFFATLEGTVLSDVTVQWEDRQGRLLEGLEVYPDPLPDVFVGRPLQLVARGAIPADARVVVRGRVGEQIREYRLDLAAEAIPTPPWIETLFGRARLDRLQAKHLYAESATERAVLQDAIIETALQYQLLSPYTARVAVEETVVRQPDGTLQTVHVPTLLPRGWNFDTVFGTATNDPTLLASGSVALALATWIWCRLRRSGSEPES